MGFGSRKEVRMLLKKNQVTLDGMIIKDGKIKVDPIKNNLAVNGVEVIYKEFIYIMMNKPKGVISATEDSLDRTVLDLLKPQDAMFEPFPVGRLDKDTTGLMLLTNDGQLAHFITSPKSEVDKTYLVHLNEGLTEDDISALQRGVTLDDGYVTMPAVVELVEDNKSKIIRLTIKEGKFHQVKRMIEARGKKVVNLKRERIGTLYLDEKLKLGKYRELKESELASLEQYRRK